MLTQTSHEYFAAAVGFMVGSLNSMTFSSTLISQILCLI